MRSNKFKIFRINYQYLFDLFALFLFSFDWKLLLDWLKGVVVVVVERESAIIKRAVITVKLLWKMCIIIAFPQTSPFFSLFLFLFSCVLNSSKISSTTLPSALTKNNCLIRGGLSHTSFAFNISLSLLHNNNERRTNVFQKAIKFSLLHIHKKIVEEIRRKKMFIWGIEKRRNERETWERVVMVCGVGEQWNT